MANGIFITGGLGYLGRNLASALLGKGQKVYVLDLTEHSCALELENKGAEIIYSDILKLSDTALTALKQSSTVIHLACATKPAQSDLNPLIDININIAGSVQLLMYSIECGIKKFVFSSSGGTIYGNPENFPTTEKNPINPLNLHGAMKASIETYIKTFSNEFGLDYAIMRVANLYGPSQHYNTQFGAVSVFSDSIIKDKTIEIWGDGKITRDYIHISDTVSAFMEAAQNKNVSGTYNVGTGIGTNLNEIIGHLENISEKKAKVTYLPSRKIDVSKSILSPLKLKQDANWEPKTTLLEGLKELTK